MLGRIIVIGASAEGVEALTKLVAALRHRMAERAARLGNSQRAQNYHEQAKMAKQRALPI
jgi:hypothetical protein